MNLRESFTLCPAFPSESDDENKQSRVIAGTIRQDWETTDNRRFEIAPESGLGIRATPFEVALSDRNLPINGTISTAYLETQRQMPIPPSRRQQRHGSFPPAEIIIGGQQALFVDEARQAMEYDDDDSSIESSVLDDFDYYGEEREEAAAGNQDSDPSDQFIGSCLYVNQTEGKNDNATMPAFSGKKG